MPKELTQSSIVQYMAELDKFTDIFVDILTIESC